MHAPDKHDADSDQPLPGSVSNQNAEEAEPGHDSGPTSGRHDRQEPTSGSDSASGGEAGEGSQSTGNPNSAG